jgi:hypothetical protein
MSTAPDSKTPTWLRWASIPIVAVVVLLGVWVTGALITNNETVSKGLTALWFGLAGLLAIVIAWRWRPLALPVLGTFVVVAATAGGFLLYTSTVDKVVDEEVVVADVVDGPTEDEPTDAASEQPSASEDPEPRNVQVAAGEFVSDAHPTSGTARVIDTADGERVLTLTDFRTDPGPDLRVYLVPRGSDGVSGGADLGALKGNEGDQQYMVPKGADVGSVVIWCRAFSVAFGGARLT